MIILIYNSLSEWNSDSSCTTSSQEDCESPNTQGVKNPYHQEHAFEDLSAEIPLRASNPIINDVTFKRFDQQSLETVSQERLFSKLSVYNF